MRAKQKPYKGLPMEGPIASWYTKNTRDDSRFAGIAMALTERLPAGASVLEVAPGPGYLAIELVRAGGFRVHGLDISKAFVRIASENAQRAGVVIEFRHGNASALPYEDGLFDFVVCSAAFKNFSDPLGALNEFHRVLRPGGGASVYDLRNDASPEGIADEVRNMRLNRLNAAMTRWTFRHMLLKNAYSQESLTTMASQSRFGACELVLDKIGFEMRLKRPNV